MPKTNILITGASGDIGQAFLKKLAKSESFACTVLLKDLESLRKLKKAGLDNQENIIFADLANVNNLITAINQNNPPVDVLVNIAGNYEAKSLFDFKIEEILNQININFLGALILTHYCANKMKAKGGGKIINISSGSGNHGGVLPSFPYAISKNALNFMTKILPKEFTDYGIKIQTIVLRFAQTKMLTTFKKFYENLTHQKFQTNLKIYQPEEVADKIFELITTDDLPNGEVIELS